MKVRRTVKKAKGLGNPVLGVRVPADVLNAFVAACGGGKDGMRAAHEEVRKFIRGRAKRGVK